MVSSTNEAGRDTERIAALCGGEVTTLCSTADCTTRISGERSPIGRVTGLRSGPSSGGGLGREAVPVARGGLGCERGLGGAERCAEPLACARGKEHREADLSGDCAREA